MTEWKFVLNFSRDTKFLTHCGSLAREFHKQQRRFSTVFHSATLFSSRGWSTISTVLLIIGRKLPGIVAYRWTFDIDLSVSLAPPYRALRRGDGDRLRYSDLTVHCLRYCAGE